MKYISINNNVTIPKYKQIVFSIEKAIAGGVLKKGDLLPSLNAIKEEFHLSRDTVLTAFKELKNRGIINSVVGKGYYIESEKVAIKQKIFLLFDELNSFKEDLYHSFLQHLGGDIQVDIFFHHFNSETFQKLIHDNNGNYTFYVIMPSNLKNTVKSIEILPKDKVYILDQTTDELKEYPAVYQNFEKNMSKGLFVGLHAIRKYEKMILLFSDDKQPKGLLNGFLNFCNQYNINNEVIFSIDKRSIKKGDLYVVLDDRSLIKIIKKTKEKQLAISKDVGIICYNDTLLKEVVADGITTISTDFKHMGKRLAGMILKNEKNSIENPSKLIFRNSI